MVAAARLRRAQANIINARPYADKIASMISILPTADDKASNIYFSSGEVKNVALVVITADRGLCGAFNQNIIKEAEKYIDDELKPNHINSKIYCVGKKSADYFVKRDYDVLKTDTGVFTSLNYSSALRISDIAILKFLDKTFDKVILVYNTFISIIQQKVVVKQLLPIKVEDKHGEQNVDDADYIYEPVRNYIFEYLIPKYLKAQVWRALLESNAAELSARMTAMDNATTNAEEMIKSLNLKYNKERQAAITKEILEIVSGANALRASSQ